VGLGDGRGHTGPHQAGRTLNGIHVKQRPVAVVIGAGFGGLAAAIRLSVKGYDVQVYDKLDAPGGRASVFRQDGHTFDAGPTIITAPFFIARAVAVVRAAL